MSILVLPRQVSHKYSMNGTLGLPLDHKGSTALSHTCWRHTLEQLATPGQRVGKFKHFPDVCASLNKSSSLHFCIMLHIPHLVQLMAKVHSTGHPGQVHTLQLERGRVLDILEFPTHVDTFALRFDRVWIRRKLQVILCCKSFTCC